MRGPKDSEDHFLADSCTLLILVPVTLLLLAYCCHPFWKRLLRSMCDERRGEGVPEITVLDPTLLLLSGARLVVLDRQRRPLSIPADLSSLDIHELEAGRLSLGPTIGDTSSQGSKDNLQSPIQDYLPPPSYESIFGQPIPSPVQGVVEPPSYTDAITNLTFHLPESAV